MKTRHKESILYMRRVLVRGAKGRGRDGRAEGPETRRATGGFTGTEFTGGRV